MRESKSIILSDSHLMEKCEKSYPGLDLVTVWKNVCNGDKDALGRLFASTFDSLYSYGYRITPQSEDVRDAIQEVFFQIWKYRDNLTVPDSVRAYLYTSLRRELLNKKKASKRRIEICNKYFVEEFDSLINYDSWAEILNLEERDRSELKKAIEKLTPRQREAIFLKYYEGLTTEELSQILHLHTQSTYNLVFSAINKLRYFLDK